MRSKKLEGSGYEIGCIESTKCSKNVKGLFILLSNNKMADTFRNPQGVQRFVGFFS